MESLDIQGFSYERRQGLLAELAAAFATCGGWVLERRDLSATSLEYRVEIQLRSALDLYAALVATGLEFTRSGHEAMTRLCLRRRHARITAELGQIVTLRFEIAFLDDVTLYPLLACSYGLA